MGFASKSRIPLDGKPEFAVADGKGMVYVNIEDKSELTSIDARKAAVVSTWPLAPCEEPSGLAMDQKNRRLFAGCDNKLMAIVNADTGKVITTLPIGEGVDATAFDPETQLAFSSNGDGTLTVIYTVIYEDSPGAPRSRDFRDLGKEKLRCLGTPCPSATIAKDAGPPHPFRVLCERVGAGFSAGVKSKRGGSRRPAEISRARAPAPHSPTSLPTN